jgi:hypothetical protein
MFFTFFIYFQEEMSAKLPLLREDIHLGEATVLKVFNLSGKRKASVAGCRVKQGQLRRKETYRVVRNNQVIFEGTELSISPTYVVNVFVSVSFLSHRNDLFKVLLLKGLLFVLKAICPA